MKFHHLPRLIKSAFFSRFPAEVNCAIRDLSLPILVERAKSRIRRLERHCATLGDYFDLIQSYEDPLLPISLSPSQRKQEIVSLLRMASKRKLRRVTEIGTRRGGTFYLLCKVSESDALIMTIDIDMPLWRKRLVQSFAGPDQTTIVIKGDSHQQDIFNLVRESAQNGLDLLFIDGDHSYKGVKSDFEIYSPLVANGGWVVFHDIVPDYRTRYGVQTNAWSGGVPIFWKEVKRIYRHFEIVDNPKQDGAGLGVLVWRRPPTKERL